MFICEFVPRRKGEREMKRKAKWLLLAFVFVVAATLMSGSQSKAAGRYLVKINKRQCTVTVYKQDKKGNYSVPVKAMVCSPGPATPTGTFRLKEKIRWHVLDGPCYGQYCSRITGGVLFHSVWYYKQDPSTQAYYQYNRLGTLASHGCVRLSVGDSKWIYDNVASGSLIKIYNAKNPGPLGKPKAIKVKGYTGWDPTDTTDSRNPYNKKKPTITGAKTKTITYGAKDDLKSGLTVKNTTGFNSMSLLKIKIQYRAKISKKYTKAKKVDTKKPGYYKITYSIKDEIGRKASKTVTHKVLTAVNVSSIKLNHTKYNLTLGGASNLSTVTLKALSILPAKASYKKLAISSSNKSVATVSSSGVVTAKGPGTCTITFTAKDGSGTKATCTITVKQLTTGVTLTTPQSIISVGGSVKVIAAVIPTTATNKSVTFTSSNTAVATVDADGNVTGVSAGTVTITATTNDGTGKNQSITIMVQ
jgi:uncharacterized protein YjdB